MGEALSLISRADTAVWIQEPLLILGTRCTHQAQKTESQQPNRRWMPCGVPATCIIRRVFSSTLRVVLSWVWLSIWGDNIPLLCYRGFLLVFCGVRWVYTNTQHSSLYVRRCSAPDAILFWPCYGLGISKGMSFSGRHECSQKSLSAPGPRFENVANARDSEFSTFLRACILLCRLSQVVLPPGIVFFQLWMLAGSGISYYPLVAFWIFFHKYWMPTQWSEYSRMSWASLTTQPVNGYASKLICPNTNT